MKAGQRFGDIEHAVAGGVGAEAHRGQSYCAQAKRSEAAQIAMIWKNRLAAHSARSRSNASGRLPVRRLKKNAV
jgi:hypothetical protein